MIHMPEYQVLARKYRPQTFKDVVGQEAIITTLKNAIKQNRLAHAYLFCGSRGTGKTTIARILAKALNCENTTEDLEPCGKCSTCRDIASGHSLNVLEIDGASHRGIDDIRQINETVGYASSGKYKIYIIDEVHMLTKEAFNALLKTLEEPPHGVKFFFATTEPHKVLPTILSRCQRFNLSRIPTEKIMSKLRSIAQEMNIPIQDEALHLLSVRADGGLRDAESLMDQIIAFHEGEITAATVAEVLGIMPRDQFFELDRAGKEGQLSIAFEIAYQVFTQGKDLVHFVESLADHFRTIILVKLSGKAAPFIALSAADRDKYEQSAKLYSQEQCMTLLDFLVEQQQQIRFAPSPRIALEAILLKVIRSHARVPVDYLVRRLSELENALKGNGVAAQVATPASTMMVMPVAAQVPQVAAPVQAPVPKPTMTLAQPPKQSITEDPTPSRADLGLKEVAAPKPKLQPQPKQQETMVPSAPIDGLTQSRYDTLMQFAAVELEGSVQRKSIK